MTKEKEIQGDAADDDIDKYSHEAEQYSRGMTKMYCSRPIQRWSVACSVSRM